MQDLGRFEDLPECYRAALTAQYLVPLWPSLRGPALPAGRGRHLLRPRLR
ncbi:MAG: hypothetical protein H6R12_2028, partial [Proteobacteria bacterium]|nr:hypothetical protein [Pseudomonadota bacterium]